MVFQDRQEAGRKLAARLSAYMGREDVVVLALPRGGVPVAYEIAEALRTPLDVMVVRKLGTPGHEELAMGAIASGGVRFINQGIVMSLGISENLIQAVAAKEERELQRRERLYRGDGAGLDVRGKTVILVDDGAATGATMHAAITALRLLKPGHVVVAVPTAAPDTYATLTEEADEVVCLTTPDPYIAVGLWYRNFPQVSDREVQRLLHEATWGPAAMLL